MVFELISVAHPEVFFLCNMDPKNKLTIILFLTLEVVHAYKRYEFLKNYILHVCIPIFLNHLNVLITIEWIIHILKVQYLLKSL